MLTLDTMESALKILFKPGRVKDLTYKKRPLLGVLPKRNDFFGKSMQVPLRYGDPQNRSAQFGYGQRRVLADTTTDSSDFEDFMVTRAKNYGFAYLDGETVEAAGADIGTFVRQAANEIEGTLNGIANDLARDLYRGGTGLKGRIGSIAVVGGNSVITLLDATTVRMFEIGERLWAATTETGAVRSATADVPPIRAVDVSSGTITVTGDVTAFASAWAANDYLFAAGDAPNGASLRRKVRGLDAWLPAVAPTGGDNFFGVDRSVHPTRLAGIRYDGTGETVAEALLSCHMEVAQEGGDPNVYVMNHYHAKQLLKEMEGTVERSEMASPDAKIGFKTFKVMTTEGDVDVLVDRNCPVGVAYLLQLDTWSWATLGGGPRILGPSHDGQRMLRLNDDDAYEVRTGFYGQLICDAPGFNGRCALAV